MRYDDNIGGLINISDDIGHGAVFKENELENRITIEM